MMSQLLAAALAGPVAFAICALPHEQRPIRTADITIRGLKVSDFPRTRKLADNVYSYEQIDPTKRTVTVNNLIVITREGVLIGGGQGTVENTKRLVADIARLTPHPIKYVVIGSEHGDHTGGISAFPPGITYFAHPFSAPRIKQPTEPVSDRKVLMLGGTVVEVRFLGRAHTGGDLEVYLPRERIVFMSEVFYNHIFPSMANGFPSEWVETLKKAEKLDARVYVPAPRLRRRSGDPARGDARLPLCARTDHRRGAAAARIEDSARAGAAGGRLRPLRGVDTQGEQRARRAQARLHGIGRPAPAALIRAARRMLCRNRSL